jgi:arylsulfatase
MTGDAGLGISSMFVGVILTPILAPIASNGVGRINCYSNSLYASMRSAIVTGRSHHSEGFGVIAEMAASCAVYERSASTLASCV